MVDEKVKVLVATVLKLHSRGGKKNVEKILKRTHVADFASLLEAVPPELQLEIFNSEESLSRKAGIMSHLDEETQKEIISVLSREEVLKIVSEMDSDDAADLLGRMDESESKDILAQMVRKDSEEVADLLAHSEDTAGGLMSSEFTAFDQNLTVAQAIEKIQDLDAEDRIAFYIYAINESNQLVGVSSLKQLLISKKSQTLKSIMFTDVISVKVTTPEEEVANVVERYDFLSIPVVDGNNTLEGVITVDDVIDVIKEKAEEDLLAMGRAGLGVESSVLDHLKARVPWQLFAFGGGLLCFAIVYWARRTGTETDLWLMAAFLPLILSMGATTGSQSATVAVGAIRAGKFDFGKTRAHFFLELKLALLMGLIFGGLVLSIGLVGFNDFGLHWAFSAALALQIVIAVVVGSLTPILLHKVGFDPTIASVPLFTTIADLSAVSVLVIAIQIL